MPTRSLVSVTVAASAFLFTACNLTQVQEEIKKYGGTIPYNPQLQKLIQQKVVDGKLFTQTEFGRTIGPLVSQSLIALLKPYEQEQLQSATAKTVATGQDTTWKNPENNTQIETKVVKTEKKTEKVNLVVA